jgi:hypothetical protein
MPFYYFHRNDDADVVSFHAEDLAAAKCEATRMAGKIICDDATTFWDKAEWSLTVTDTNGLTQFQLHFIGTDAPVVLKAALSLSQEVAEIEEAQVALRDGLQDRTEQTAKEQRLLHRRRNDLEGAR